MENIINIQIPDALKVSWPTGDTQLDQLFAGNGIKLGSLVLVTGPGGQGKSTFCEQLADKLAANPKASVVYNGREEAAEQMKLAIERLGLKNGFYLTTHDTVDAILADCDKLRTEKPGQQLFLFVDSLQALSAHTQAAQVSVLSDLHDWAKKNLIPVFVISMVGKSGVYLGSGKLNHIVDMNIKLHQDKSKRSATYGEFLLSVEKNRFGAANIERIYTLDSTGFKLLPPDSFKNRVAQLTGAVSTADAGLRKMNMGLRVFRGLRKLLG